MPDWSGIKSIARYFNRTGYAPYPAWVFHKNGEQKLLKNSDEAMALGIYYREATQEERNRYGRQAVWDWKEDCDWRPNPWEGNVKFNPNRPETGKNVVLAAANPAHAQHDLVRMIVPEVAAAVAQALKGSAPGAPPNIDPADWAEFQQFLAFKKSSEAVNALADATGKEDLTQTGVTDDQERSVWIEEAEERGIKIDKRWSLARIKQEIDKAEKKEVA